MRGGAGEERNQRPASRHEIQARARIRLYEEFWSRGCSNLAQKEKEKEKKQHENLTQILRLTPSISPLLPRRHIQQFTQRLQRPKNHEKTFQYNTYDNLFTKRNKHYTNLKSLKTLQRYTTQVQHPSFPSLHRTFNLQSTLIPSRCYSTHM